MNEELRRRLGGIDTSTPSLARMHDYFIGGKDNFAADRKAADALLAIAPEIKEMAQEEQAGHKRIVRFLAGEGIDQFITVATARPTQDHTQKVARELRPDVRTVYVDNDPIVLTHARAILAADPRVAVVEGDILHPSEMLAHTALRRLIDLDLPVGVIIRGVLQYIPDADDPFKCVARLRDGLARGSFIAISHVVFDERPELAEPIVDIYRRILRREEDASRKRAEVLRFFDGMELVEPGLVYAGEWRPESPFFVQRPSKAWVTWGVARVV
ncbi:SAM-dependent methyltransferase [Thermopolyspora sp. NPDC052614]|uniref:SAM-dependent methyltransferase n=1 Tax=Thermopolyspora sp. NPDC052614 TaxID=3155682 RepID=UPI00343209AB